MNFIKYRHQLKLDFSSIIPTPSVSKSKQDDLCYHCGESCSNRTIYTGDKFFCCEGCKIVYQILQQNELCSYYDLNKNPGKSQRLNVRENQFEFLDDATVQAKLIDFEDESQLHATFYLPQMHCSSCLYLLENLHRIEPGIIASKVNFIRKEVSVIIQKGNITLRKVAEVLTSVGYEPYLSLQDLASHRPTLNRSLIYQIGVAGFCFGNSMLLSFPEYLGINNSEASLLELFRWTNLLISLPVLLYAALPFYTSTWKSLRLGYLNIDAPIALAIGITFTRSAFEVITHTGGGYFDSMTGIVFLMLAGRILQDKTHRQLSFERDYTAYFPIAVTVIKDNNKFSTLLPNIRVGDTLLIHHDELIPADGILTKGRGRLDYSFVTGESNLIKKEMGEILYAGGKQKEGSIELLVIKEVAQSYLTRLWNDTGKIKQPNNFKNNLDNILSRYFTGFILLIALLTSFYWWGKDPVIAWQAVTSIFIVACPCALLLSTTFTNGTILSILAKKQFYLKNAATIDQLAKCTHIVFDKTGTLTVSDQQDIKWTGLSLSKTDKRCIAELASNSSHPLSKSIVHFIGNEMNQKGGCSVFAFKEITGRGIEGWCQGMLIKLGSEAYITGKQGESTHQTKVHVKIDGEIKGYFSIRNRYRQQIESLLIRLLKNYPITILSGDQDAEKNRLRELTKGLASIQFNQKPEDKMIYIKNLQEKGVSVMMIGDGLNDAGALRQADVGIALSAQSNYFTPASDAIIGADQLYQLDRFINLCKANKRIIVNSFIVSLVYNIIGLYFAIQGQLSPLIAAVLMPISSISVLLLTYGSSSWLGRNLGK